MFVSVQTQSKILASTLNVRMDVFEQILLPLEMLFFLFAFI